MNDRVLNDDYRDMISCLQSEGAEFMLVGGYAVGLPKDIADAVTLEKIRERKNG